MDFEGRDKPQVSSNSSSEVCVTVATGWQEYFKLRKTLKNRSVESNWVSHVHLRQHASVHPEGLTTAEVTLCLLLVGSES